MEQVVISGADRGLGASLCQVFLEHGWHVIAGIFMPEWPELDTLQEVHGDQLERWPLNVASDESVEEFMRNISKENQCIDLFISNAGISGKGSSVRAEPDPKEIRAVFDVNTLGAVRMTRKLVPLMRESSVKRLCYISSEAGSIVTNQRTELYAYSMSKAALNMAVRLLSNELLPKGFTFRLYHPGWMKTYMGGTRCEEADLEPVDSAKIAYQQFTSNRPNEENLVLMDPNGRRIGF